MFSKEVNFMSQMHALLSFLIQQYCTAILYSKAPIRNQDTDMWGIDGHTTTLHAMRRVILCRTDQKLPEKRFHDQNPTAKLCMQASVRCISGHSCRAASLGFC